MYVAAMIGVTTAHDKTHATAPTKQTVNTAKAYKVHIANKISAIST